LKYASIECFAAAALFQYSATTTTTPINVRQGEVTKTLDITKLLVGETKNVVDSKVGSLVDHFGTVEITNLINGLVPDVLKIVSELKLNVGDTLKLALESILSSVANIKGAVTKAVPLLQGVVSALGKILDEVLALVNAVLSLVVNLLGSLTSSLQSTLESTLVSRRVRMWI
jgi:phage-related protein